MTINRRRFKRLNTSWIVKIRMRKRGDQTILRYKNRIRNVAMGGVFIETAYPFPVGTFVEIDFAVPSNPYPIHAKGVVRWSNAQAIKGEPRGMGIEFVEVLQGTGLLEEFVEKGAAPDLIRGLTKTPLHKSLLSFYCGRSGQSFSQDVLAQFFSCSQQELGEVLKDFVVSRLVKIFRNEVSFLPLENESAAGAVALWKQEQDRGA